VTADIITGVLRVEIMTSITAAIGVTVVTTIAAIAGIEIVDMAVIAGITGGVIHTDLLPTEVKN
jgi:hypothetical protein